MNNIVLCGFMGCGKTMIGIELAKITNQIFVDMDDYIAGKEGMSIPRIFEQKGEEYFRALETQAARELSLKNDLILSAGGGAVLRSENVAYFKSGGVVVFIEIPLEVITQRLIGDTTRPLLNRPDKDEALLNLFNARLPVYRAAADITVKNTENLSASLIACEILKKMNG